MGYKHLQSLRLWDANIGDEGVTVLLDYMCETSNTTIQLIECLNCNITAQGCITFSKLFDPLKIYSIKYLTLDYNFIGNEGLVNLMTHMKDARYLKYLSLANCGIDEHGAKIFTDIFNNPEIKLEELNLQGNPLKNAGITEILGLLYYNNTLKELNLNNTVIGNNPELALLIARLMISNTTLGAYYLNFNMITNEGDYITE